MRTWAMVVHFSNFCGNKSQNSFFFSFSHRREKADSMRHAKLHRAGNIDEEGALLRSGHLELGLHHVYAARGQATIWNFHTQRHLQKNKTVWIQVCFNSSSYWSLRTIQTWTFIHYIILFILFCIQWGNSFTCNLNTCKNKSIYLPNCKKDQQEYGWRYNHAFSIVLK